MVIDKNGVFCYEVEFNMSNVKDAFNEEIGGYVYYNGFCGRILATDIKGDFPIAIALLKEDSEDIICVSSTGKTRNKQQCFLYIESSYVSYSAFRPDLYQACLIKYSTDTLEIPWTIAVCSGYNQDAYPTFFNYDTEMRYEMLPLNMLTVGILNKTQSWKEYVSNILNN